MHVVRSCDQASKCIKPIMESELLLATGTAVHKQLLLLPLQLLLQPL